MAKKIKVHQHHITTFLTCRQKFNLSENWCITTRFKKKELNLGSAFHAGVKEFKKGNKDFLIEGWKYFDELQPETQEEIKQMEWGKAIVTSMLIGYAQKYEEEFTDVHSIILDVEKKISASISDRVKLIGIPDSIEYYDGYWVGEEKTASRLDQDYVEKLPLDFQMTFYFVLAQKSYHREFEGVIYRITRVSALRQKAKQSWDQFLKEIANDYIARPEWYFVKEKLYRSNEDIDRFKNELKMQVKDLMDCYKTKHWYKDTRQCTQWGCEFMKYCIQPTEDTLNTHYVYREDLDKCFSVINKIKVDRPVLFLAKEPTKIDGGTTTPVVDDLPF